MDKKFVKDAPERNLLIVEGQYVMFTDIPKDIDPPREIPGYRLGVIFMDSGVHFVSVQETRTYEIAPDMPEFMKKHTISIPKREFLGEPKMGDIIEA